MSCRVLIAILWNPIDYTDHDSRTSKTIDCELQLSISVIEVVGRLAAKIYSAELYRRREIRRRGHTLLIWKISVHLLTYNLKLISELGLLMIERRTMVMAKKSPL